MCSIDSTLIIAATPYFLNWTSYIGPQTLNAGSIVNVSSLLITDQFFNPNKFASVSINLFSNSGCSVPLITAAVTGNSGVTDVNGLVSFSSMNITKTGNYFLQAIYNNNSQSSCSSLVSVLNSPVQSFTWSSLISNQTSQIILLTQYDSFGNIVTITTSLSLLVFSDYQCKLTSSVFTTGNQNSTVLGTATFSNFWIYSAGSYFLKAVGQVNSSCSSYFVSVDSIYWVNDFKTMVINSGGSTSVGPLLSLNYVTGSLMRLKLYNDSSCTILANATLYGNIATTANGSALFPFFGSNSSGIFYIQASISSVVSFCSKSPLKIPKRVPTLSTYATSTNMIQLAQYGSGYLATDANKISLISGLYGSSVVSTFVSAGVSNPAGIVLNRLQTLMYFTENVGAYN